MKKPGFLLGFAAIVISAPAYAQQDTSIGLKLPVRKGNLMTGMNAAPSLGFGSNPGGWGVSSFYHISANPRIGYFLTDRIVAGILLNGTFAKSSGYHSESYGGGGFVRWYGGKPLRDDGTMRKVRFFVEGGITFNGGTAFSKNADGTEDKINFSNASPYVMPGFNYFFTNHIALEAGLQLNYTAYSHFGGRNLSNEHYVAPFIGLHYFFGKRK